MELGEFLNLQISVNSVLNIPRLKVSIAANWKGVCLQNTSKSFHIILHYSDYYDFMDR